MSNINFPITRDFRVKLIFFRIVLFIIIYLQPNLYTPPGESVYT